MVGNPIEKINNELKEFANSSGDFSGMAPEKLIDISKNGEGREDFDAIIEPAVKNKDSFPEAAINIPRREPIKKNQDGSCDHANVGWRRVLPTGEEPYKEYYCQDCGEILDNTKV